MKKNVLLLLAALCCYMSAFSQNDKQVSPVTSLDGAVSRLQTLSANKAIEKAYLHLDKPYYNAGDTLYFKAYVTLGEQHELSTLSGLLHVDLVSPVDSVLQTISLQLINGLAAGDFSLAGNLPKGTYRVRAYTKWMLNNGQDNFFDQQVNINGRKLPLNKTTLAARTGKAEIQFFPEGGSFVNGIPAKLAFKAVAANGLGINVKGVVVDNANVEVTKFESKHLGMGLIFITAEAGKTYKAKLTYADGTKVTVDLPKAYDEGITLTVNNDYPEKLGIEINANKAYYLKNKNKEFGVIIYSGGSIRSVKAVLDNQVLDLNLNKNDFKTGLAQVTLFSAGGEPLNERIAFIQNADQLNITPVSDKPLYPVRGKVHIAINTKNKSGAAAKSYLSAAVVDEGKVPIAEDDESTILSNLLLTSDLRGAVEQPNYYFANVTNDTRSNLDILMLTQGYRRFEWKQLLSDSKTADIAYKAEGGFDLSGHVKTMDGKPVDGGTVTLMPQNGGSVLTQTTDAEGKFAFRGIAYVDKTQFLIQAVTAIERSNTIITLDPEKALTSLPANTENDNAAANYKNAELRAQPVYMASVSGKVLDEVMIYDKKNEEEGHSTQVLGKENLKDQVSVTSGLQGRLIGVVLKNGVPFLADKVNDLQGGPMLIIVDDVTMQQGASVNDLNIADIESVKVLKNLDASIYGMRGANGVLVIKSRKGALPAANKKLGDGLLYYTAKGFYKARTFYTPVYENTKTNSEKPDTRTAIYWSPNIVTDKDGNASFDFFNADGKGTYRLVIEGIDEAGNIGRNVLTYKVQ